VPLDPPAWVLEEFKKPRDYTADLKKLLASPNICDKRWVFEQYDSMVQTNTVQGPGGEAGVMRIKDRSPFTVDRSSLRTTDKGEQTTKPQRGIAMALAGNGRWCWLDPKLGAMHAVAEAARKVACTGATPVAATNCLNFGNPEKPEIMAQLSAAIDGIAEACTALGTPVTGGNVSLYNETKGEGIYPTPVIGVVGLLEDVRKAVPAAFQREGETILLIGDALGAQIELIATKEFGSSEFARTQLDTVWGQPPRLFTAGQEQLNRCLAELAQKGLITSASDIADGGIAVALARATFANSIGATVEIIPTADAPAACALFGEDAIAMVTCPTTVVEQVREMVFAYQDLNVSVIGTTTNERLLIELSPNIAIENNPSPIDISIAELKAAYSSTLESQLAAEVVTA
jgi:phosphoribosylformylglycinamidine synthase